MRHIIAEASRISRCKKSLTFLVVLIFIFLQLISEFIYISFKESNPATKTVNQIENNDKLYRIVDNADNVSTYLNSLSNLENLKNFYNCLSSSKKYEYYEGKNQPIMIKSLENKLDGKTLTFFPTEDKYLSIRNGEKFYSYNSDIDGQLYYQVENLFVNLNYLRDIVQPKIIQGRSFAESDMSLYDTNSFVPVLLGYDYSRTMNVGDEFSVHYIGLDFTFKVIGILGKNSIVPYNDELKILDSYIVSPFINFQFSPMTRDELCVQGAMYLDKVNGYLKLNDGYTIESVFIDIENSLLTNGINFDLVPIYTEESFRIGLIKSLILVDYKQSAIILAFIPLIAVYLIVSLEYSIINSNLDLFVLMDYLGYSHRHVTACKTALTLFNTFPAFAIVVVTNIFLNISSTFCLVIYIIILIIATISFCFRPTKKRSQNTTIVN